MSPSQVRLLQQSFVLIEPINLDVGRTFFEELFRVCPQTQDMFGDNLEQRWQQLIGTFRGLINRQLRSMLTLPATATKSKEAVTPEITNLAQNYVERGFTPKHMSHLQHALLESLSTHLGDRFDEEMAQAWSQYICLVIHSMQQTMSREAVQPALPNEQGRTCSGNSDQAMDRMFVNA